MELRFHVSDDQMHRLQERTEISRAVDVAREGLDLLDWATQEAEAGYRLMAVNDEGTAHIPIMGALNRAME